MLPAVQTDYSYKAAVSKEGRITALKILIDIDAGCFNPFAQEITDRLAISSCSYYKPENVYIEAKCHTSKTPPTSINIKNLDSLSFFAIENQMQELCKITHLFPSEIRATNVDVGKSNFPFHIQIDDYKKTFENSIRISDFNRKYASFNMDAITRASKDTSHFFGLPLRGIGVSSAYNVSAYYGESSFSYNPKVEVKLLPDNKVEIHTIRPSEVIQEIWKQTVGEILQIKKENITINSDFLIEEIPSSPEDTFSSISTMNEIIRKCCMEIKKKRFHQPLPIICSKTLGTSIGKGWNKQKFTGNPFGTNSFATTVVEVELDSYTYSEKIKGIWITINCGQLFDKAAALKALRLEIQQELTMLVSGKTIPCDNYTIEFIESENKSGQINELIRNTLPAAFSTALSLALATQLNEIPCTENQLYSLMKERELNKVQIHETEKKGQEKK